MSDEIKRLTEERDLARAEAAALRAALVAVCAPSAEVPLGAILIGRNLIASTTTGADVLDLMRRMAAALDRSVGIGDCLTGCECVVCTRNRAVLADYKRLMGEDHK